MLLMITLYALICRTSAQLIEAPQSTEVIEGGTVKFTCKVHQPRVDVDWLIALRTRNDLIRTSADRSSHVSIPLNFSPWLHGQFSTTVHVNNGVHTYNLYIEDVTFEDGNFMIACAYRHTDNSHENLDDQFVYLTVYPRPTAQSKTNIIFIIDEDESTSTRQSIWNTTESIPLNTTSTPCCNVTNANYRITTKLVVSVTVTGISALLFLIILGLFVSRKFSIRKKLPHHEYATTITRTGNHQQSNPESGNLNVHNSHNNCAKMRSQPLDTEHDDIHADDNNNNGRDFTISEQSVSSLISRFSAVNQQSDENVNFNIQNSENNGRHCPMNSPQLDHSDGSVMNDEGIANSNRCATQQSHGHDNVNVGIPNTAGNSRPSQQSHEYDNPNIGITNTAGNSRPSQQLHEYDNPNIGIPNTADNSRPNQQSHEDNNANFGITNTTSNSRPLITNHDEYDNVNIGNPNFKVPFYSQSDHAYDNVTIGNDSSSSNRRNSNHVYDNANIPKNQRSKSSPTTQYVIPNIVNTTSGNSRPCVPVNTASSGNSRPIGPVSATTSGSSGPCGPVSTTTSGNTWPCGPVNRPYQDLLKDQIGRNTLSIIGYHGYMPLKPRGTYQRKMDPDEPNYLIV
ncbi:uncharacterized protein [Amphiura filiformis]|uniref:uncharacterized protein n=1 Tax=Amphiura filiformis TaxID=82378 RepID=UPI003B21DA3C